MSFSDHFPKVITSELLRDQTRDVTTIEVDLPLPTSKPDQAKFIKNVNMFLKTEKGLNIIFAD